MKEVWKKFIMYSGNRGYITFAVYGFTRRSMK